MLGKVITEHGQVVNNQDIMVVHLHLKEGETIPAHNHPGRQIFFTVVEGDVEVYLDEKETYPLVPKKVLDFDGEATLYIVPQDFCGGFSPMIHSNFIPLG